MDYIRILTIVLLLISLIFLPHTYSTFAQRLNDLNNSPLSDSAGSVSQSDTAGSVINATDINNQPSIEASQSTQSFSSNSTGSDQSSLAGINSEQQSIELNNLLLQLQRPVVGSFGDDRITGTQLTDIIIGFSGSDTITGINGSDIIQGNEGQDKLYGDPGDDILQGGVGSDQFYGGTGNDIMAGGGDDDFLVGEAGNDKLYGDLGDDILVGGPGADYFDCGEGVDVVADFNIQQSDDRAGNCEELIELS
jgi:Ca2+-binding RTX toxin-like protein